MIPRRLHPVLRARLARFPAVALLGARQVGKTTLAGAVRGDFPQSVYLDLESPRDRMKLVDAEAYLARLEDRLVVIDEVQRLPELFPVLRSLIDAGRARGRTTGRFLLLGSASGALLRQSGESLAGRIAYLELPPLQSDEVAPGDEQNRLWLRGGFPLSFLAANDADSLLWRQNLIATYLERDIPALGGRLPAEMLRRLWTMLAHQQGGLLNVSQLARNLMLDTRTVNHYLDVLVDLLLVRRLLPWQADVGKRLAKSPKVYVRDCGLVHALLGIESLDDLLAHPVVGASWEGWVIENILAALPFDARSGFYRTASGVEMDLVIDLPRQGLWAIEVKRTLSGPPTRGFHQACTDLAPRRRLIVIPGDEPAFPVGDGIEAIGLRAFVGELRAPSAPSTTVEG